MVRPCPCGHSHCLSMASSSHTQMHYNLLDDEYSSSLVDCTLSLGTPSTRKGDAAPRLHRRPPCNLQLCKPYSYFPLASQPTATSEALLTRRCANCDTTSTPLWRNGPKGPKSLCNACGIRFKKEERRATAAAATNSIVQETHVAPRYYQPHNVHQYFLPAPPLGNELSFTVDDVQNQKHQFLSWRLNLTDRPATHLHDFTR